MESIDINKVVAGVIAAGLIGIGAILADQIILSDSTQPVEDMSEYIPVKFVVLTQENEPIEGVNVQFIFEGSPVSRLTDTDGFVGVDIPKRDAVQVILRKEGFKTINRSLNLQTDPRDTITYQMEEVQQIKEQN